MKNVEKMSAAECTKALDELRSRQRAVVSRLTEIEPPGVPIGSAGPTPIGAPARDALPGAGVEFRRIALEGTAGELAAVIREHEELGAEAVQLAVRIELFERRLKEARAEEARRAAPGRARKLLEELPGVLDRLDAALLELAAAVEARETALRDLDAARVLTGGEPYYSPELLRRVWASAGVYSADVLRKSLSTRPDALAVVVPTLGGQKVVAPEYRRDALTRLEPPKPPILERFRRRFAPTGGQLEDVEQARSDAQARMDAAEARARELAAPLSA
ncbi:MAG: hypothetical protein ABL963_13875 [Longimicrobiales bacterium]